MPLSNKDARKLIDKGFILIRPDYENLKIKHKTSDLSWKTLEADFTSKAALNRKLDELLEKKNIIQD